MHLQRTVSFPYPAKWKIALQATANAYRVGMATSSGDNTCTFGNAHIKSQGRYFSIFIRHEQYEPTFIKGFGILSSYLCIISVNHDNNCLKQELLWSLFLKMRNQNPGWWNSPQALTDRASQHSYSEAILWPGEALSSADSLNLENQRTVLVSELTALHLKWIWLYYCKPPWWAVNSIRKTESLPKLHQGGKKAFFF